MRILFLSRWFPYPPDNGSKIRIFNLLKHLAKNHEISLVSFADLATEAGATALQALGEYCASVRVVQYREFRPGSIRGIASLVSPSPRYLVATFQAEALAAAERAFVHTRPQLIIASQLAMAPYAMHFQGVPLVLEELEVATFLDATRRPSRAARRLRAMLTWTKLTRYLRRSLPRFAACTVVSEGELANLRSLAPEYSDVRVVTNGVDVAHYAGDFGQPRTGSLVFSGALTYQANYDAARYFLSDIYPAVLRSVPDARLRITGRQPQAGAVPLPTWPGVEYTGYVDDIRPVVAQSWASIVPLRVGGGTRLKILESMALGTPVVATSKGAEGLLTIPGVDILIADEPADFARQVIELIQSPDLRAELARAGRRLVETTYDWTMIGGQLDALIADVGDLTGRRLRR